MPSRAREAPFVDEIVLWIESFYDGMRLAEIARESGWPEEVVYRELIEQGVMEWTPPEERGRRRGAESRRAEQDRISRGELNAGERKIANALRRLDPDGGALDDSAPAEPRAARLPLPQDAHHRAQEPGLRWRGQVRAELRAAGLIASATTYGGTLFRYWT